MIEPKPNQRSKFFLVIGLTGLAAVFVGFSTTFFIPVGNGTFEAPPVIYIHGALAFSWVCLFIIQSWLIRKHNFSQHKLLGFFGLLIAIGITLSLVPVGLYQVEKELAQGLAHSSIVGTMTSAILFLSLVVAAYLKRREPSIHKRLMLLATILLLWPAWFRFRHFFPSVPDPEIWFAIVLADSLIVISIIWDRITFRRFNPILLWAGLFIIAEHTTEAFLYDNPLWRAVASSIFELLN